MFPFHLSWFTEVLYLGQKLVVVGGAMVAVIERGAAPNDMGTRKLRVACLRAPRTSTLRIVPFEPIGVLWSLVAVVTFVCLRILAGWLVGRPKLACAPHTTTQSCPNGQFLKERTVYDASSDRAAEETCVQQR